MTSSRLALRIPTPCTEPWAAMTPTHNGRHCTACQTEVIDFARMTQAEVVDYLATRGGQQVCARLAAPVIPKQSKRLQGPRRWLLAAAVVLGWQSASAQKLPPQSLPKKPLFLSYEKIIVQGVVLDDSLSVPVSEAYVFIDGTKYGAVTDEHGRFTLWLPSNWEPIKTGVVALRVTSDPFTFLDKLVEIDLNIKAQLTTLTIRLLSDPERGIVIGKAKYVEPPIVPPLRRKSGS